MGKSNMQKMREALEAAHEFVYALCRQNIDVMVKDKNGERVVKSKDVLYKIYSALSEPARNCDFGTADEQLERFRQAWTNAKNGMIDRQSLMMLSEYARWSQQKYYEGDAE